MLFTDTCRIKAGTLIPVWTSSRAFSCPAHSPARCPACSFACCLLLVCSCCLIWVMSNLCSGINWFHSILRLKLLVLLISYVYILDGQHHKSGLEWDFWIFDWINRCKHNPRTQEQNRTVNMFNTLTNVWVKMRCLFSVHAPVLWPVHDINRKLCKRCHFSQQVRLKRWDEGFVKHEVGS